MVLRAGERVSEGELIARVAERKGSFKAPKTLEFVERLPETVVHKLDRRALMQGRS